MNYDDLAVGDLFIEKESNEVKKKLKGIPPVVPIATEYVRKATEEDKASLPVIVEYPV